MKFTPITTALRTLLVWHLCSVAALGFSLSPAIDQPYILAEAPYNFVDLNLAAQWAWHTKSNEIARGNDFSSVHWTTIDSALHSAPHWDIGYKNSVMAATRICNESTDTLQLFFNALRYRWVTVWEIMPTHSVLVGQGGHFIRSLDKNQSKYWIPVSIPPGVEKHFLFNVNVWLPTKGIKLLLYSESGVDEINARLDSGQPTIFLFFIVLYSLLTFLALAGFVQWLTSSDKSYLYYTAFVGLNLLYLMVITEPVTELYNPFSKWATGTSMFCVSFLMGSYLAYFRFSKHFLSISHPLDSTLQKNLRTAFAVTLVLLVIQTTTDLLLNYTNIAVVIVHGALVLMMPLALYIIFLAWRTRELLARLLAFGMLLYVAGSVAGFCFSTGLLPRIDSSGSWRNPFSFTGIGVLAESSFFFFALGYRLKLLYQENTRLVHVGYAEKERIARDLHDEVGSTLTTISILSESVLRQVETDSENTQLTGIGEKARAAISSMGDIVWAVNPKNDSMDKIIERMIRFAAETLEPVGISTEFHVEQEVDNLQLKMEQRKDFYLLFKEATTNVAKHSGARRAIFSMKIKAGQLQFKLADDGKGIPERRIANLGGNGLQNMHARAGMLGAVLEIKNGEKCGCLVELYMPIS